MPRYENMGTDERINKLIKVLKNRQLDLTVVAENINDPHNLSAMLRSCDAVGLFRIYLVYSNGQSAPQLGEQSSASARKWVETIKYDSIEICYKHLRNEGFSIFTTKLDSDSVSLFDINFNRKVALVFGNEHAGVSQEAVSLADGNFLIPQIGMIQSLNISVACAVSLYEAFRQRQLNNKFEVPQITVHQFENCLEQWLLK